MLTIKEFRKVSSIEEAYELNQKKTNRIIGGMLWLKMQTGNVNIAIDLSGLNLDTIEETDTEFKIGAMTTLRDLELHAGLNQYTNNSILSVYNLEILLLLVVVSMVVMDFLMY